MASNLDLFLKIDTIKGESLKDGHQGEIDITSWSFSANQAGASSGARATGKVHMSDISVTKPVDSASPALFLACCSGEHIPKAIITGQKAAGKQQVFYKVTMTDIIVAQVRNEYTHEEGALDSITEIVTLNPATVKVSYTPIDQKGTPGAAVDAGWDILSNKKL